MNKNMMFKPRARLMPQLGDQLIKNEYIALLELVKNSYDADAENVWVKMLNLDSSVNGKIIIEDDGDGMNLDIVENSWMEIGTDNKKHLLDELISLKKRSKLGRLPMGEKGIGRFGVHKLGEKVTLITRTRESKEVIVKIDWTLFDQYEYLDEVPIFVAERIPEYFTNERHGTYIEISGLKGTWTRGNVRDAYRSIMSLQSPFESIQSFAINFETTHQSWISDLLKADVVREYALFFADVWIQGDEIKQIEYHFKPWKVLNKLDERVFKSSNIKLCREERENGKTVIKKIDLKKHKIGPVKLRLMIFDLDNTILSYGVSDKKGLKEYLRNNGGISVYRDNIRIYEYGEKGNDWLELESRRINSPASALSSKITIGAVYIDRENSGDLIEKTNREGFVENSAFVDFRDAVVFAIEKIQTQRNIDKDLLKKYYGISGKAEPVLASVSELNDLVDELDDENIKKKMRASLKTIEADYKSITDVYIRSATAGLSLSVVIHEIEKIIAELKAALLSEDSTEHIKILVADLSRVTDGYASVIRSNKQSVINCKELIDNALFNVKYRLKVHEIEIESPYKKFAAEPNIKCASNLVIGSIMNIVDNSIYWLTYAQIDKKKMYFDISEDFDGFVTIIVADNGRGFTLPTEQMIKPFVTDRPGGMGLGLHLADEIMRSCNGILRFPSREEISLPEEYQRGAILGLSFPKQE